MAVGSQATEVSPVYWFRLSGVAPWRLGGIRNSLENFGFSQVGRVIYRISHE